MYQEITTRDQIPSKALDFAGVSQQVLYRDSVLGSVLVLVTMKGAVTVPEHVHATADETVLVLEGEFNEHGKTYGPGTVFRGKAGTSHGPQGTNSGCVLLTFHSTEPDFTQVE